MIAARVRSRLDVVVLAVLTYPIVMLSSPGRMPADSKLYLYLDPGTWISRATLTWDTSQYAGFVPHQQISYLWPAGPWFWVADRLALPDWIAHRLWLGTLLFLAGCGALWLARMLGLARHAALGAAVVYMLSPYVLAYVSRTSVMMLPWAGLGWIIGLTIRAATTGLMRYAAWCALVVLTVGSTNATALAMIAPAPLLWLLHAALDGRISWRRATVTGARIGGLCLAVSVWWIVMLMTQSRFGADVLSYTETLEAVSSTSTAPETIRGLGYWLLYIRDHVSATTDAAAAYHQSAPLVLVGYLIVLCGAAGLAVVSWNQRRFAALLVVVGMVLAVGVYPITDPAPMWSFVTEQSRSTLALALRSSTRALPMVVLGLALGAGALVSVIDRRRARLAAAMGLVVLGVAQLPALWTANLVDKYVSRDQDVPDAWVDAAAALDSAPGGFRVLQVPGAEFGSFRWGHTVDPPLPGLSDTPLVTRDLQPLGSPGAMDLLYALDDRYQSGTADATATAVVARLLGARTVWAALDMAFERYDTPRPELTESFFRAAAQTEAGLGTGVAFGDPAVNEPSVPMLDEQALGNSSVGTPVPPVVLVPVDDPIGIGRVKVSTVVLAGSGDGIVDAAAAGLLTGDEAVVYAADLRPEDDGMMLRADRIVITDSNRDRAHHWRSSQDVWGFTEDGATGPAVLRFDSQDQRLPVFATNDPDQQTIVVQEGPVRIAASSYGQPFGYWPEYRPAMAIDGDPATAWRVAEHSAAIGEFIELTADTPITSLQLHQPTGDRSITEIEIVIDGTSMGRSTLGADARQIVRLDRPGTSVRVVITATTDGTDAVGFTEIDTGLGPTREVTVVPTAILTRSASVPVEYVFTRLRVEATDRQRDDPESGLVRRFVVGEAAPNTIALTARLSARSPLAAAALLGVEDTTASSSLAGVPRARGWAATDGDPSTAWVTAFGPAIGQSLTFEATADIDALSLVPASDPRLSHITAVSVSRDGAEIVSAVGAGRSQIRVPAGSGPVTITITAVDEQTTVDRAWGDTVAVPVGVAEIDGTGVDGTIPRDIDTGCRDDLLTIDGVPMQVRITGSATDALDGAPLSVATCNGSTLPALAAGDHVLAASPGRITGIDIDQVTLTDSGHAAAQPAQTIALDTSHSARQAGTPACPDGCWLVLGEGVSTGWSASIDSAGDSIDLGTARQIDGGFNGWWIPPGTQAGTATMHWAGQRPVDIALVLGAMATLGCVGLIVRGRRRAADPASDEPAPVGDVPRLAPLPRPVGRRRAVIVGIVTVAVAAVAIGPLAAVVATAVVAVCCVWLARPQLLGYAGLGGLAVVTLYVLEQMLRLEPAAGSEFLAATSDAHQPTLLAVLLIAAAACAAERPRLDRPASLE